ncbi:hypothetical protein GGI25_003618 [Coemansia spiralis]|uniref:Transmembrane protein n=2 Tax=Coemansia TaxID=4863 RepID=A0A9W8G6B1_9FUNG|nr:hypothetical protein BX070DRAFT_251154 [Coemansia spiralis]KAJ1996155.1 hypothetical protein EDC05_000045 [Coemansia umbellata]KAJ2626088.1 hypothetical protein GGI26_000172 [Coemansia sp. RSA 1358]KAJ2676231.1 hypothetical protein GGI25_003618 [Coemansia spiralis]
MGLGANNRNQNPGAPRCGCGSVCWLCYGRGVGPTDIPGQDAALQRVSELVAGTPVGSPHGPPAKSNPAAIRPLRSWSSSEKSGPCLEPRRPRGPRRFSVAGPAASSGSVKSGAGSRKSHALLSLHTWAEEEEVADDPFVRPVAAKTHPGQALSHTHHKQQSSVFVRRAIPEAALSFVDIGLSCSSSGGTMQSVVRGHRLRTPYSISIPSMIGSPLSFTQPFLAASRTSIYGRQPPSSQIRAAHIDWDSQSMAEEAWNGNRNADLPLWQGMAIDPSSFSKNGRGVAGVHKAAANAPGAFCGQPYFPHAQLPAHLQYARQHLLIQQQKQERESTGNHRQQDQQPSQPQQLGDLFPDLLQPNMAELHSGGVHPAAMAQLAALCELEKQMSWDYTCQHHPMLASFAVASPLKLSSRWRWGLLCVVVASTLCVFVGTPVALIVLLAYQDTAYFANP